MKKRLFSCLLAVLLLAAAVPAVQAADLPYTDVSADHWAYADIQKVTQAGLFQGVDSTHFGVGQTMTRAQFVTALVRLFGWETVTPETPTFSDCAEPGRWFYSAVETAYANGALPPYSSTFRPLDPITREEMATMIIRSLGYTSLAGRMSASQIPFTDVTTNQGYIAVAYDLGIVNGYDGGLFKPDQAATREQAAAVLGRLYDKYSAASRAVSRTGYTLLTVPSPEATADSAIPTTPLEPFNDLYDALKAQRAAGTDMSQVAVVLSAGGIATTVQGSRIVSSRSISQSAVEDYLEDRDAHIYYSEAYQCAYLTVTEAGGRTVTVWYQNEESMAAKLLLCRLFGVNAYVLEE